MSDKIDFDEIGTFTGRYDTSICNTYGKPLDISIHDIYRTIESYEDFRQDEEAVLNLDAIVEAVNEANSYPPTIPVWIGKPIIPGSTDFNLKSEYPKIVLSELVNDEEIYILAGFGVIAGKQLMNNYGKKVS